MLEKGTYISSEVLNEMSLWNPSFKKRYIDKSFLEKIGLKHRSTGSKIKQFLRNNAGNLVARGIGSLAGAYAADKLHRKVRGYSAGIPAFVTGGAVGGELGDYLHSKLTGKNYREVY